MRKLVQGLIIGSLLAVSTVAAAPVGHHELYFIKPGVREAEVLQRLGEPDQRFRHPATITIRLGHRESMIHIRETWVYVGDSQVPTKRVELLDGIVTSAH